MVTESNSSLLETKNDEQKTIYVVGGGIYGCHTALELAKKGYKVVLLEKNSELFSELSGKYGVRIHQGPHYLRSPLTRKACREGYEEFAKTYPDLINEHEYSIYALGALKDQCDADSKVSANEFESIFKEEYEGHEDINLAEYGYTGLHGAKKLEENSMAGGAKLREYFTAELLKHGVEIRCNANITNIEPLDNGQVTVNVDGKEELADHVVNATSFKAFLPPKEDPLPLNMETKYQCTVVLIYDDLNPTHDKPFSFIVMDGAYPCIMPYIGRLETTEDDKTPKYMLYHATHTIRGTFDTYEEAQAYCNSLTDKDILELSEQNMLAGETETLREQFEKEINRFFPGFAERFKLRGWHAATLAKIRSDREFRTTVTFGRKGITYVFPGKVNDIFKVAREVEALIENKNILCAGNYRYVQGGVLDIGKEEIAEKPSSRFFNTCDLRTNAQRSNSTAGGGLGAVRSFSTPALFKSQKRDFESSFPSSLQETPFKKMKMDEVAESISACSNPKDDFYALKDSGSPPIADNDTKRKQPHISSPKTFFKNKPSTSSTTLKTVMRFNVNGLGLKKQKTYSSSSFHTYSAPNMLVKKKAEALVTEKTAPQSPFNLRVKT